MGNSVEGKKPYLMLGFPWHLVILFPSSCLYFEIFKGIKSIMACWRGYKIPHMEYEVVWELWVGFHTNKIWLRLDGYDMVYIVVYSRQLHVFLASLVQNSLILQTIRPTSTSVTSLQFNQTTPTCIWLCGKLENKEVAKINNAEKYSCNQSLITRWKYH